MERADKAAAELPAGSNRITTDAAAPNKSGQIEQRAKRFDECGIEEKIARLRDAMLSLAVMADRAANLSEDASRIAKVHDHGAGGQVVVPLAQGQNEALMRFDSERPFRSIQRLLG